MRESCPAALAASYRVRLRTLRPAFVLARRLPERYARSMKWIICTSFALATACASGPKVESGVFSAPSGRTVGYGGARVPVEGYEQAELPEPLRDVAVRTVRDVFITKGYGPAAPPAQPELTVYVGVGQRERTAISVAQMAGAPETKAGLEDFVIEEGSVVFQVMEGDALIYLGSAEGVLSDEPDPMRFARALRAALADIPDAPARE